MDDLVKEAIDLAKRYKKKFNKPLGVTGEVGEHIIAENLNIFLSEHQQEGYDGIAEGELKIQIKSRILKNGNGRVGRVKDGEFDKLVVASFDDNYNVLDVYVVSKEKMEEEFKDCQKRKVDQGKNFRNPSWSRIKKIGRKLNQENGVWDKI